MSTTSTLISICRWRELDDAERARVLSRPAVAATREQSSRVAEIIAAVRSGGDDALRKLTRELDGVDLDSIAVGESELREGARSLSSEQQDAIRVAAANIERFHALQRQEPIDVETMAGVRCQRLVRPLDRVGLYVPAGSAPLPSTALMLGVPAKLAGCDLRILCCPPAADGRVDAAVLFAARLTGINKVYKIGGAQAIAAMAYGTETVPKVDKLFGPGNSWVTEAKTQVDLDPAGASKDYPAGPSEVLVIADANADPAFVAADLLSQAEHGEDSQSILVTTSEPFARSMIAALDAQLASLPRREIAARSLAHAAVLVADDIAAALEISNRYAPEHLILQFDGARDVLDEVRCAGSVFVGPWTPESVGDYCSGTNHVLPTYGYASRYSSLGLNDFLRTMTVQELTSAGLERLGPVTTTLARTEGLEAHARAVDIRLNAIARRELEGEQANVRRVTPEQTTPERTKREQTR